MEDLSTPEFVLSYEDVFLGATALEAVVQRPQTNPNPRPSKPINIPKPTGR